MTGSPLKKNADMIMGMDMNADDDRVHEMLIELKAKADRGKYMDKSEELWLGRIIYESHPWTYPVTPGGSEYRDISTYPPRTDAQKRNAALAKTILYSSNRRLVFARANRYHRSYHGHVPQDECEMNGFQGLARALDKYDYRKGCKFSTYAVWWIRRDIHRGTNGLSRIVDIPEADMKRFTDAEKDMEAGIPKGKALENHKLTESAYRMIADADAFYTSLETPIGGGDDSTLMDVVDDKHGINESETASDPEGILEQETMMRDLALAVAALPGSQRRLMSVLYGPDRKTNGKYRPVSDTRAREELGMGKREYEAVKADAMAALRRAMGHWRQS